MFISDSSYKFRRVLRKVRLIYQKLTRGWSDEDTWSLNWTIAQFILPRLIRFKELNNGFPYGENEQSWNDKLQKMINSFTLYLEEDFLSKDKKIILQRKNDIELGFQLFITYFYHLWW